MSQVYQSSRTLSSQDHLPRCLRNTDSSKLCLLQAHINTQNSGWYDSNAAINHSEDIKPLPSDCDVANAERAIYQVVSLSMCIITLSNDVL